MSDNKREPTGSPEAADAIRNGGVAAEWKKANRDALDYARRFVEENGVPFARHRRIAL
ncbi:type II toxin-antitoxin system CcdA family antitoxin [Azospirillum sp. sgz301742]